MKEYQYRIIEKEINGNVHYIPEYFDIYWYSACDKNKINKGVGYLTHDLAILQIEAHKLYDYCDLYKKKEIIVDNNTLKGKIISFFNKLVD